VWHDLLIAAALMLIIEGIIPFINPNGFRQALLMLLQQKDSAIRIGGLASMIVGLILLYLVN